MHPLRALRFGWRLPWRPPTAVTVSLTTADGQCPLPGPAWVRLLGRLRTLGVRHVLLAGGRPLRHPHIRAILDRALVDGVVLLVTAPEDVDEAQLRGLPALDTLAIAAPPHRVREALAAREVVRACQPQATAEVLLLTTGEGDLTEAARLASDAGALVFLSPVDPHDWGDVLAVEALSAPMRQAVTALSKRAPARLVASASFLADLARRGLGPTQTPCVAAQGVFAVDPWGRPRPCRGRPALGARLDAYPDRARLDAALRDAVSGPCRCTFDDHDDHATARRAPAVALARAVRRTLASWRQG